MVAKFLIFSSLIQFRRSIATQVDLGKCGNYFNHHNKVIAVYIEKSLGNLTLRVLISSLSEAVDGRSEVRQ